jgi:uncharacterized membrane protein
MSRLKSIDVVRGIVMVIMALDHVRDLMHIDSIAQSPTDLATTTPALFFTRWITHLCAPVFVSLAGSSVYLSMQRTLGVSEARKLLVTRGIWLIVLEFTVVNFAIFFDIGFHTLLFEVIASTGFGFIVLSLLLGLRPRYVGMIGLAIIFGHNLTVFCDPASLIKHIVDPLVSPLAVPVFGDRTLVIGYPPIPWLGIMLAGFAAGEIFGQVAEQRRRLLIGAGIATVSLFIVIRLLNVYGDATSWGVQVDSLYTFMSFMNVSKYPPSLAFCLITLGIMFFMLAFSENLGEWFAGVLTVYGRVPLFYFILHFYLVHVLTIIMLLLQGVEWRQLAFTTGTFGRPTDMSTGVPLWGIYLIWVFVVAALYLPCFWFGRYKATHDYWWLRYL